MTVPNHLLGVDLLKLILRAKDPFLPRFHCHSCKQKFNLPMNSTSPVSLPPSLPIVVVYVFTYQCRTETNDVLIVASFFAPLQRPTHCTMCSSDFIEWVLPE